MYKFFLDLVYQKSAQLAEVVLKIDYLIEYANSAVKAKDYNTALETVKRAEERVKLIKRENYDVSHLEYLIEGVKLKIKK